jgi:hypothetical protein
MPTANGSLNCGLTHIGGLEVGMKCRNCGESLSAERVELGYDYCTEQPCVDECLKGLDVVAVHVNKASDQYVLREQLDIPDQRATWSVDPGWAPLLAPPAKRAARGHDRPQTKTTVQVIDELEAALDAALAVETDPRKRNKLINDYNAKLRHFDIRYRRTRQRHSD